MAFFPFVRNKKKYGHAVPFYFWGGSCHVYLIISYSIDEFCLLLDLLKTIVVFFETLEVVWVRQQTRKYFLYY